MMTDGDSEESSVDEVSKRFVPVRSLEEFQSFVGTEEECLCAIVVTSFICPFSASTLTQVKERFVMSEEQEARLVRYFHVALVPEDKTDITNLLKKDPVYIATNRQPTDMQKREMHKQAHADLLELLTALEVRSTPCLLFYLRGKPLRVSDEVEDATPMLATGSSIPKWKAILQNAVIRRNEVMREYDEAKRQEKRRLRREQLREERKRAKAEEEEEDEEDKY